MAFSFQRSAISFQRSAFRLSPFAFILCTLLLWASTSSAAAPRAVISGPTRARGLQLVALDASESVAAEGGLCWVQLSHPDDAVLTFEGGQKVVLLTPASGRVELLLIAVGLDGGKAVADQKRWSIAIGDDPGPNPPGPNPPGPGPTPPPDPGRFNLAAEVLAWSAAVPADQRSLAPRLAENFEAVASAVAAGVMKLPADIIGETNKRNTVTQGASRKNWGGFWESLRQRLNGLADRGELKTPEDYATAWREIAAGLRGVKAKG